MIAGEVDLGAYRADPTRIGVDDTTTNCNAGGETQVGSGFVAEVTC